MPKNWYGDVLPLGDDSWRPTRTCKTAASPLFSILSSTSAGHRHPPITYRFLNGLLRRPFFLYLAEPLVVPERKRYEIPDAEVMLHTPFLVRMDKRVHIVVVEDTALAELGVQDGVHEEWRHF